MKVVEIGHYRERLDKILHDAEFDRSAAASNFLELCREIVRSTLSGEHQEFANFRKAIRDDAKGLGIGNDDCISVVVPAMIYILEQHRSARRQRRLAAEKPAQWIGGPRAAGVSGSVSGHRYI